MKDNNECRVVFVDNLELGFKVVPMQFRVKIKDLAKDKRKVKYTKYYRAKEMEEFKKISKDLEDR